MIGKMRCGSLQLIHSMSFHLIPLHRPRNLNSWRPSIRNSFFAGRLSFDWILPSNLCPVRPRPQPDLRRCDGPVFRRISTFIHWDFMFCENLTGGAEGRQLIVITHSIPDLAIGAEVASHGPYGALLERGQSDSILDLRQTD